MDRASTHRLKRCNAARVRISKGTSMSCVAHKVVKQPVNVYPVSSILDSGCDRPRGILPSSHSFYIFFTHLFLDNIILSFYSSVIIATKLILFFSEIRLDFLVSFFFLFSVYNNPSIGNVPFRA